MSALQETPTAYRPARRRSRWVWGAAALLVAMLAGLAVACGDDGTAADAPTATPAATGLSPDDEEAEQDDGIIGEAPPFLTVNAGQESIVAAVGTFCWKSLCADAIGPITPVEPLAAGATELKAELAAETIAEFSVRATSTAELTSDPVDNDTLSGPGNPAIVAWLGGIGEGAELPATADGGTLQVDISTLEPGQYIVSFFVRFESGGDASYGVLLNQSP